MSKNYQGDYIEDATVYIYFTTNDGAGGAVAPSSAFEAADINIYKNGSVNQKTAVDGLTMTSPFDSITGLHLLTIDTSNDTNDVGFWVTGADYAVILTPDETVDSQTIVSVIAEFSIKNRSALRSTVDGRTLDVTATGAAGIDWGNIENKTTVNDLTQTDIQLCDTVTTNSDMVGTNGASLASVVGTLGDGASDGDPTAADTIMQYIKQLINTLVGTVGISTFPIEAAPANNVSLSEVIRAIHADVTGLNGDVMVGTNGANTVVPPSVAEFDARSLPNADYVVVGDTIAGVTLVATTTDITNQVTANITAISGDSIAADNLELDYDGTGYTKANSVIGTTTVNTDMRGTDSANIVVPPSVAEFNARSIPSADYVLTSDTITAVTTITNDVGITQAGADKVWSTAARVLTANTNFNDPTTVDIVTAIEADGGDLSSLMEALVNKLLITEATGAAEIYNDSGISQGTVAAAFTSIAGVTKRERLFI